MLTQPTPYQLLKEAEDDVRAMAKLWAENDMGTPVIFVVDWQDKIGAGFVKAFVPPKDHAQAQAVRDGGIRADVVPTVLTPMTVDQADKALSKMATKEGQSLHQSVTPDKIIVIVVACGAVTPFSVNRES